MKHKFFELAKKLARTSEYPDHKLGAVIVKGNTILGVGVNKLKTHPKAKNYAKRIHAELAAILNARTDVTDCDLYVFRYTQSGLQGISKPCDGCMCAILEAGIKRVYYSTADGYGVINA
jgi:dCMP deaminase